MDKKEKTKEEIQKENLKKTVKDLNDYNTAKKAEKAKSPNLKEKTNKK